MKKVKYKNLKIGNVYMATFSNSSMTYLEKITKISIKHDSYEAITLFVGKRKYTIKRSLEHILNVYNFYELDDDELLEYVGEAL